MTIPNSSQLFTRPLQVQLVYLVSAKRPMHASIAEIAMPCSQCLESTSSPYCGHASKECTLGLPEALQDSSAGSAAGHQCPDRPHQRMALAVTAVALCAGGAHQCFMSACTLGSLNLRPIRRLASCTVLRGFSAACRAAHGS